jgi:hypothetical protein
MPSRAGVERYLPERRGAGASARALIGQVKRQLVAFATSRAQADLAATLAAAIEMKPAPAGAGAESLSRGSNPGE